MAAVTQALPAKPKTDYADAMVILAQRLASGTDVSATDQIAHRLIAAAIASASTDDSGATLENAAASAAATLGGGFA